MRAIVLALAMCLMFTGCASDKKIDGTWYEPDGLAEKDSRNPCIHYRFVVGNLVWAIFLSEMIIPPVYFIGWSLWEPVGEKSIGCLARQRAATK